MSRGSGNPRPKNKVRLTVSDVGPDDKDGPRLRDKEEALVPDEVIYGEGLAVVVLAEHKVEITVHENVGVYASRAGLMVLENALAATWTLNSGVLSLDPVEVCSCTVSVDPAVVLGEG